MFPLLVCNWTFSVNIHVSIIHGLLQAGGVLVLKSHVILNYVTQSDFLLCWWHEMNSLCSNITLYYSPFKISFVANTKMSFVFEYICILSWKGNFFISSVHKTLDMNPIKIILVVLNVWLDHMFIFPKSTFCTLVVDLILVLIPIQHRHIWM